LDERICANCHGRVSPIDLTCRHCGASFRSRLERRGSFSGDLLRAALGLWTVSLPLYCVWLTLRYDHGWGEFFAYLASEMLFVPWLMGVITLGVLVWLTQERR